MTATAGNKGDGVKSDCFVTVELTGSGGQNLNIQSRVDVLYGESIRQLTKSILDFYEIENAFVNIEDSGSFEFVISARIEAAIKKVKETSKEFLPGLLSQNTYQTRADARRFSRLYLPGNTPGFMINAGIYKPDGIILDLEDSVAHDKKDEARILVRNALRQVDFFGAERMVRINQLPLGIEDLEMVVPQNVNLILIPKCEHPEQVQKVDERIYKIKKGKNLHYAVWLMPIIESAMGVEQAFEIARASENVVAVAIGLEDYTADLGIKRTIEGKETFFARSRVVNAAKAAGIQAIDSVFSDVDDAEGLKNTIINSKSLGYEGMGCIHPGQIPLINELYSPDSNEIEKAKKIVMAFESAKAKGLGVVSLGSKMIDAPVVKRAMKTIEIAISLGKVDKDWMENELLMMRLL